ncbi:hypothetical protein HUJ05_006108 [Dendroctonus ponderosae]|nr:hypothetical protein HUJ05_006108 [Dendroctonus ponderosae]
MDMLHAKCNASDREGYLLEPVFDLQKHGNYSKTISSLVEHGTVGMLRPTAVARVGQAVNLAVERFVTVGETIADDYQEIRQGMYEACKEARQAGAAIEHICEETNEEIALDRSLLIRAAKCLLAAITRVLLLADIVVVKQLLLAKDKVSHSLDRLESVNNFTEFVKAFSQFGAEMVELAHLTGDRQNDLKDERRRAQMAAARQVLERSTMMLLTSSKTSLRHPNSNSARENRDTVFCQMRRAMDLIHYVVKDGVLNNSESGLHSQREELENDRGTAYACMRHLQKLLEHSKATMGELSVSYNVSKLCCLVLIAFNWLKHGTTTKPLKAVRLDTEEQEKIAKSGLEMKLATSEMEAETEKWQENNSTQMDENNDIVKRAKNMSSMAFSMYQFTKGEGPLKTTQDLFTQAEYFAEEANRLYKVIRQFSYQVPGGAQKKELLENLDKVPTFVQRLQFTVKDHTVGKAATFTKVDNVIQETKNLMNVISKVVTVCFECATKFNITLPQRVTIPCDEQNGGLLPGQLSPQALHRLINVRKLNKQSVTLPR